MSRRLDPTVRLFTPSEEMPDLVKHDPGAFQCPGDAVAPLATFHVGPYDHGASHIFPDPMGDAVSGADGFDRNRVDIGQSRNAVEMWLHCHKSIGEA